MTDVELAPVLSLLAASGGTARTIDTWRQDRMTALVLGDAQSPSAVMPLSRRTIQTRPGGATRGGTAGRALEVGWLSSNQFASRMGLRRQTVATAPEWSSLLPDIDALVMLRREEAAKSTWMGMGTGGGGGRWYARTGFDEVLSIRCLYLDMETPPPAGRTGGSGGGRYHVQVISPVEAGPAGWASDAAGAARWQHEMLAVYRDVYGSFGGAPARSADFWAGALAHHYYGAHYQFQIIGLWNTAPALGHVTLGGGGTATLMGYAVVGWSGWHSKRPRMDILELATRQWDTGVAAELIQTTCQLAWSKQVRQVRAVISAHDPYRGHFTRTGFADRWGYVMMAKWLHAQRTLDALGPALPAEFGDWTVELLVPGEVPLTLRGAGAGGTAGRTISLVGSRQAIARLMLNRLEITAALQEGTLASARGEPLTEQDIARLSLAFPWTPWAFHMVDFI